VPGVTSFITPARPGRGHFENLGNTLGLTKLTCLWCTEPVAIIPSPSCLLALFAIAHLDAGSARHLSQPLFLRQTCFVRLPVVVDRTAPGELPALIPAVLRELRSFIALAGNACPPRSALVFSFQEDYRHIADAGLPLIALSMISCFQAMMFSPLSPQGCRDLIFCLAVLVTVV